MASASYKYRYVHELPYPPRKDLCDILDADGQWEELGGTYMHHTPMGLKLIGQAIHHCKGSPTSDLLDWFGQKNGTINHLFVMLHHMGHQRAMRAITAYVDKKYHHLIRDGIMDSSSLNTCSSLHGPFSNKSLLRPSAPDLQLASTKRQYSKDFTSNDAKFLTDSANMNNFSDGCSYPQKLPEFSGAAAAPTSTSAANYKTFRALSPHPVEDKIRSVLQEHKQRPSTSSSSGSSDKNLYKEHKMRNKENSISNMKEKKLLNIPLDNYQDSKPKKDMKIQPNNEKNDLDILGEVTMLRISYNDLLHATDEFDRSRVLGQGGFGIVYKGEWKGIPVAVKRLIPKEGNDNAVRYRVSMKQSLTEINALYRCRIDNILPLYGVCLDGPEPCLVYQFMINGSLEDHLLCKANTTPLSWPQRANIAKGMARGLHYLHSLPDKALVHGDIKSANILLDANMDAKIGDFGLAREGPATQYTHIKVSTVHGTQVYLPPEYLRERKLSPKVDVYSFGIVLLEMATGQRPFNDKRSKAKLLIYFVGDSIKEGQKESLKDKKAGTEEQEWFEELLKTGQKCATDTKRLRPEMKEVLDNLEEAKERIEILSRIKKLKELPPSPILSPIEIQMWYDVRKTDPHYHPLDPRNLPRTPPILPRLDFEKLHDLHSAPPPFSSFDPSQIRWPPNDDISIEVMAPPAAHYHEDSACAAVEDSSCGATVDSSNYANNSLQNMGIQENPGSSSSSSDAASLPLLTELGIRPLKDSQNNIISSTNLGPTPAPSGVLSDFNAKGERLVIRTPKPSESSLMISSDDDEDDDECLEYLSRTHISVDSLT